MKPSDLEVVLNKLVPFAKEQLRKHGSFWPIGAAMDRNGDVALAMGAKGKRTSPAQSLEELKSEYQNLGRSEGVKAVGICWDSILHNDGIKTDAISVGLESQDEDPTNVYIPYERNEAREIRFGDPIICNRTPEILLD